MPTRCFMPARELVRARVFPESVKPHQFEIFAAVSCNAPPRIPFISRPNITFCLAESQGSNSACWNTMPRWSPQPLTSRPSTVTRPPLAGSSPMATRSAVVLPQPDGPISATTSPSRTVKLTRSTPGRDEARRPRAWKSAWRRRRNSPHPFRVSELTSFAHEPDSLSAFSRYSGAVIVLRSSGSFSLPAFTSCSCSQVSFAIGSGSVASTAWCLTASS